MQQLRRSVGATGNDNFQTGFADLPFRRGLVFDSGCSALLDQHAGGVGVGPDRQVRRRIAEIGFCGAPAAFVARGGLVVAAAFLLGAVEIWVRGDAGLDASLQHGFRKFAFLGLIGDVQRAAGAVECVGASCLVLGFLEVGQHRIPIPAGAAALAPLIVVGVIPAYIHQAVDGA